MLPIKSKIIIASTLAFGLMLIGFADLVYESSKRAEISKLDTRLESQTDKLQTEIEEQFDQGQFPDISDLLSIKTEGLRNAALVLYDTLGHFIVADSKLVTMASDLWRMSPFKASHTPRIRVHGVPYRCRWSPVEIDERAHFVLLVAAPLTEVHENLEHLWILFLITIPAAIIVTALAAFYITRTAFRPVTSMIETARLISASNLDRRLEVPRAKDEVRMLADTLNNMIERIDAAFRSQRQFVADASHEIRTPLTIVYSELELALKNTKDNSTIESIEISLSEIDRLAHMADDLLLLARLDSPQVVLIRQPVRIDEILAESVKLMSHLAGKKNIRLNLQIEEAVEILGDADKLKRVAIILIDNAIKYSAENGEVKIHLRIVDPDRDRVRLTVEDNGQGIAESDSPHIFERFYQSEGARAEGEGSGLGLSIAQKLVELHGGRISVQSEIGKGTLIIIELPRIVTG